MDKQVIALVAVLVTLSGGLGLSLVNCFNAQQKMLDNLNNAFIEQTKQYDKDITRLHKDYNDRIIDLIIKGQ